MAVRDGDYLLAQFLINRRQFLAGMGALYGAAGLGALTGCGSGSGGGVGSGPAFSGGGRVVLPGGVSMSPASLSVVTGASITAPASNGQFSSKGYTPEPSLAVLTDSTGNSLLLGFIDPQTASNTIDATSTAVALLFFAIGGPTVPPVNKRQILQLLTANAVTPPLAAVISARMGASVLAIQNGDIQITSALQTAYTTLTANVLRAARRTAPEPVGQVQTGRAAAANRAAAPIELIQPAVQQSGVEIVQPPTTLGVEAINHFRRRARMYVYRVGEVSTAGAVTSYAAAVRVVGPVDIAPTAALGLFTTLDNLFSGLTAFTPVISPPQALTIQPNTKQTNFEVVIVGASGSAHPPFFSDPKYSAVSQTWITDVGNLNLFTAIGDVALGFILELWGLRFIITEAPAIQALIDALSAPTILSVTDVMLAKAKAGQYSEAIADLIRLAAESDLVGSTIKQALKPYIAQVQYEIAVAGASTIPGKLLSSALRLISAAFTPIGITVGLGDLAAIAHDLTVSSPGDLWTAKLVLPTFTLNPAMTSTTAGGRVTFSVKLPAGETGKFLFDWSQSSPFATLSASNNHTGNTLETNDASITVDLVTTPSDSQPITVTVTAFEVDASGTKSQFGVATAKVTIGTSMTVQAGTLIYTKNNTDGSVTLYGFFTFPVVQGATQYLLSGGAGSLNISTAELAVGAPVVNQSQDLTADLAYKTNGSAEVNLFFNLGGGLIGVYTYPGNFPPSRINPGDEATLRKSLMNFFTTNPGTVTVYF